MKIEGDDEGHLLSNNFEPLRMTKNIFKREERLLTGGQERMLVPRKIKV